jgi:hypothetical protein
VNTDGSGMVDITLKINSLLSTIRTIFPKDLDWTFDLLNCLDGFDLIN